MHIYNCTTIGYVRLHASIAGKQAQLVGFSRSIKIYHSHGKLYWFIGKWIICFCYRKWCTWSWKSFLFICPIVWFSCRKGCTWSWKSFLFVYPIAWFSCRKKCTWSWISLLFIYPIVWFSCRKWRTWSWISLFFIYPIAWFSCRKWYKWLLKFAMLTYWVE